MDIPQEYCSSCGRLKVVERKFESVTRVSKQYCPDCGSFKIHRKSRGFIKSKILNAPKEYECSHCKAVFTALQVNSNEEKELPLFIQ